MADETSITPKQAGILADAVYALKDSTIQEALDENVDLTGGGAATNDTNLKVMGTSGLFKQKASTGFGYCTQSKNKKEAFIVTRGTNSLADVLTDLDAIPMSTGSSNTAAAGFVKTFKSIETQVQGFLNEGSYHTIHCIGHSLGGALATLIANKYAKNNHANIKLYTFGSPRVFFGTDKQLANIDSYRVYHEADPVPMLGPFPLTHYDGGIGIGSGMSICNPFKHVMSSYQSVCGDNSWADLRGTPKTASGIIDQSKSFMSAGGAWMFRALQHVVTYGIVALGIGVAAGGAAIFATYTAVDILYKLLQKGLSKLSSWIVMLLKTMSKFIKNGWESPQTKSSDSYYKSKNVIYYIIEQFLIKMKHLAMSAISTANKVIGAGADAMRTIAPVLGASYGATLPIFFL
jgi:triacylglycerol lipase